ncbi:MAG: lytic transglycosylase domain-containing protein [Pseudomonadota bacterium]
MSSMANNLRSRPKTFAALIAAGAAAFAAPCTAQFASSDRSQNMVATQPSEVAAGISQWERLHARNATATFAEYVNFALRYPDFPRTNVLRGRAEAQLEKEAAYSGQILQFFDRFPPLTNSARARYAVALASSQRPEAAQLAREAWRGGSMAASSEAYLQSLFGAQFTPEDHSERMDALLWQKNGEAAVRHMMNLPVDERPLAQARLSLVNGSTPSSVGATVPQGAWRHAGYIFNLASYQRTKGQTGAMIQTLANRSLFDAPAYDPEAMVGLMLRAAAAANVADTVRIASKTEDLFAPGIDVSEGSFKLRDQYTDLMWKGGTNALWRQGDGRTAAPMFERYGKAARGPLIRAKGFYWAGRAASQAGMQADAARYYEMAAEYPQYYYGQLALGALGRDMPTFAKLSQLEIDRGTRAAFNDKPLTHALRSIAANRRDWRTERRFFQAIANEAETAEELRLTHQLALELNMPELAVVVGAEASANGFKGFERIGYPTYPTPRVNDWTMVHAISRQESEFDRTRTSHAGARGLMQLMPGTAREQAGKMGLQYMSSGLYSDPAYNIRLGDGYFARMMDYYRGSYPLAVAAYNAGPGNVNKWLRRNGDPRTGAVDWQQWIEQIGITETRYYVMHVLGNATTYSHMYPEQAGLPRKIETFFR